MNTAKPTGLGEPEITGKKSLFQPPKKMQGDSGSEVIKVKPVRSDRRVRMTLEISMRSLSIIQESQGRYRIKTGHPLPKWKIIGDALELYEKKQKGEGSEA